jgi:hypothetical protein
MEYKNTRTGAVISSLSTISGKYWIEVEDRASDEEKANPDVPDKVTDTSDVKQIVEEVVEEIDDSADGIDGITVKQIKQELDAFGIKYDPRLKKQELYELMLNGK